MRTKISLVGVGVTISVALGCGGSGTERSQSTPAREPNTRSTAEAPTLPPRVGRPLPRPLLPTCGVERFGPPEVTRAVNGGWRVLYSYPRGAPVPPAPGQTTVVNLDERPPKTERVKYANEQVIHVRGRKVYIVKGEGLFIAQWISDSARYGVIANGTSSRVLRKIIACSP